MNEDSQPETSGENWLTSVEAARQLRISSCHLMHLRESGKLRFKKRGNSFLYLEADINSAAQRKAT